MKPIKTINNKIDANLVKSLSKEIGFDDCGISSVQIYHKDKLLLSKWLESGMNAGMDYMTKNGEVRQNPELLLENAKSVISLTLNYKPSETETNPAYYISKYARGLDYHYVMKSKMRDLVSKIEEVYPEIKTRVFTDSAPVLERAFSRNSGLGFIGKNTCLIHPQKGSFFFIGEIICDYISDYDRPLNVDCGNCSLCVDACPVGALSENGLDANKCISYHTIENSGEIPKEVAEKIINQVFGCDICQNVCPFNQKSPVSTHREFKRLDKIQDLNLDYLQELSNSQFNKKFADTSLQRAGRKKLITNFELVKSKIPL